jgi:hypothetical protein
MPNGGSTCRGGRSPGVGCCAVSGRICAACGLHHAGSGGRQCGTTCDAGPQRPPLAHHGERFPVSLERHEFYTRAPGAFTVVATGKTRQHGNIMLKMV